MIPLVDAEDIKGKIDENGTKRKVGSDRKCCYPDCTHPYDTYIDPITGVAAWYRKKDIINGKKVWDGVSWYCNEHEHKMRKVIRKGTLDKNHNTSKGNRVERAFEKIGYRNCNKEKDNYNFVYDLYDPINKKRIQVRSVEIKLLTKKWIKTDETEGKKEYLGWQFAINIPEYDNLFAVCMTKDYMDIERLYNIPIERLPLSDGISIYKENVENHQPVYSRFHDCIDDKLLQIVRKPYHEILIEDGIIKE